MTAVTAIVSVALALLFLAAALAKFTGMSDEVRARLNVPLTYWKVIGVLELAGAVGVLIGLAVEELGIAAATGLLLTSAGAIATHLRAGDPPNAIVGADLGLVLSTAVVVLQAT
jgi:uncharacterized membrane protein YphA (DoxX/SURF4 family)